MSTFDADLVRELRALPLDAPASLRERVRALGEPEPGRSFRLPRVSRRAAFVLVPACVLALVAAAVIRGVVVSSTSQRPETFAKTPTVGQVVHGAAAQRTPAPPSQGIFGPNGVAPNPNRYQDYQGSLRVRVQNFDALGQDTARAMQITQSLGGYVASVDQSTTAGAPGEADLVLRVPVARVQTAMVRLAGLGTVLDQHVSIQDLNAVVNAQRQRILQLKIQMAQITATLKQSLPADVRLRLQFQLAEARRNLASITGANRSTLREAALSRIQLALTTEHPAAVKHRRSFLGRSTHAALAFLAGAGAVALAALIVISPLIVLAVLAYLGVRAYRRREERRLLAAQ